MDSAGKGGRNGDCEGAEDQPVVSVAYRGASTLEAGMILSLDFFAVSGRLHVQLSAFEKRERG